MFVPIHFPVLSSGSIANVPMAVITVVIDSADDKFFIWRLRHLIYLTKTSNFKLLIGTAYQPQG
jgi:hypothetical protein